MFWDYIIIYTHDHNFIQTYKLAKSPDNTDSNPKVMRNLHSNLIPVLTHYHTMLHFDVLKMYSCGKHFEKRRNSLEQAISPFSQCFLPNMALIFHFKCTLKYRLQFVSIWPSLKLSSGNELTLFQTSPGFYVSAVQVF